jgi:hypothetical protein
MADGNAMMQAMMGMGGGGGADGKPKETMEDK